MLSKGGEGTREREGEQRGYREEGKRSKRRARAGRPMRNEGSARLDEVDGEGPSAEREQIRERAKEVSDH